MIEPCRLIKENYINKPELDRVFQNSDAGAELDASFLCFEDVYFTVRDMIDDDYTVIDLGCAYAPQSYIFRDCKAYIGVDCDEQPAYFSNSGNSTFYFEDIKKFINKTLPTLNLDLNKMVAICSYVPGYSNDKECKIITDAFPQYYIQYCDYKRYHIS